MKRTVTSQSPIVDYVDAVDEELHRKFRCGALYGLVVGVVLGYLLAGILAHW